VDQDGGVRRELNLVDVGAVEVGVASVIDVEVLVDVPDTRHPVPCSLGPVSVRLVVGVACETRGDVEEADVCDGVLVGVTAVRVGDLPA